MRPIELVEILRQENPDLLGNIPDKRVARIIRLALARLALEIDAADEGVVKVLGFGNFRIRQIEQEKAGETVKIRRVIFRPASKAAVEKKSPPVKP